MGKLQIDITTPTSVHGCPGLSYARSLSEPIPSTSTVPLEPSLAHDDGVDQAHVTRKQWSPPPTYNEANEAYHDISNLISPRRKKGHGYSPFVLGNDRLKDKMHRMRSLLYHYSSGSHTWMEASRIVARFHGGAESLAKQLRSWTRVFIADRHVLPFDDYHGKQSLLEKFPELKLELTEHLMSVGKYVRALDIVEYMGQKEVMDRYHVEKVISLSTAQQWMHELDYRWLKAPSGQFADGHERPDVVDYRENVYLPALARFAPFIQQWDKDGQPCPLTLPLQSDGQPAPRVIIWTHDESTFYAHD